VVRRERKEIKIVGHYMMINGKKKEIDPLNTNLPDRCKLALVKMGRGYYSFPEGGFYDYQQTSASRT